MCFLSKFRILTAPKMSYKNVKFVCMLVGMYTTQNYDMYGCAINLHVCTFYVHFWSHFLSCRDHLPQAHTLFGYCRHPEGANRPTFSSVLSTLSHPVDQLLYWNEGDRAAHQHADWLGGSLEIGQYLYRDLQHTYFSNKAEL